MKKVLIMVMIAAFVSVAMGNVLSGKLIVIDPGHGGVDTGAIGPTGLLEKNINLQVALDLEGLLKLQGADVVMTRATDVFVSLARRIEIANQDKADLFLCIHHNSIQDAPEVDRPQTFYWSTTDTSKLAAGIFLDELQKFFGVSGNLMRVEYEVLRLAKVPAILVEACFMSSPSREKWLENPVNLWREALVYDQATLRYFEALSSKGSS